MGLNYDEDNDDDGDDDNEDDVDEGVFSQKVFVGGK